MATKRFDLAIIGAGNAGLGAMAVAHEAGKSSIIVEARDFGGTCPNRGCTPKKVLVAAAHALHEIGTAVVHGIAVGDGILDWSKLIDREKAMIAHIPGALESTAKKRGEAIYGSAKFVGPNAIAVGERRIEADNIVIATGSKPRALPIAGAEAFITSEEVLSERAQPESVVFVGGGVIALEFSHVYARAGTKVTILEALPRLLPRVEADAVAKLHEATERLGVTIETAVEVERIERTGDDHFAVHYRQDGEPQRVSATRVVNGAGRVANLEGLDLEAGEVAHDDGAISLDPYLRSTSNPAVWAAGDTLTFSPQLSPIATYEGQLVVRNIVEGAKHKPDYSAIPQIVFTIPALASVGMTEEEARNGGHEIAVHDNDISGWLSAKTYGEKTAWAKVIVERKSERILGAHIVGHNGDDLIHLFAFAIKFGITASQIRDTVYGFPTFASDVKNLL